MTRVQQVYKKKLDILIHILHNILHELTHRSGEMIRYPYLNEQLEAAKIVARDVEAYRLLNDIRMEHVHVVDNEGILVPITFS